MQRLIPLVVPFAGLAVGALAAPASAAEPVVIESTTAFGSPGTFTATGEGLCASGTTADSPTRITGSPQSTALTFHLDRTFTCADGSGSFTLRLQARVQACDAQDAGSWVVIGGDGDYADLHGAGSLAGTYLPNDACDAVGVVDVFSGRMSTR